MKVILLEDVKNLGTRGSVVNVSDGYARNYLLPRRLAVEATPARMKELAQRKAIEDRKREEAEAQARELAARLNGLTVQVKVKVGEGGRLFGAINTRDIAENLEQQHNITVDKKKIMLKEPIKQLGEQVLVVKLHPNVQAQIRVAVVPED
ncbi:MAG: large subunit ribosomal protein [Thermoanaerobacter sp.]|uniref:50S ribosomal protein L9 n=1 Tax=Desulfofundulus thermocisternus TaxID=42471 RepID=UPI00048466CF|nr:50S ribosomal protein L9 [Desulfofundulus thermocisternus]MDK2888613.1 large subunit ribosomal protein [Thermoanaerobacter sp.]